MRALFDRMVGWRGFPVLAPVLVGTALFVLGVVYLNLDKATDKPGFIIVGGSHGLIGEPIAVRVSARAIDSKAALPVAVNGLTVQGKPVEFKTSGSDPLVVMFRLPDGLPHGKAAIALTLSSGLDGIDRTETVEHTLSVMQGVGDVVLEDGSPPAKRVAEPGEVRVDVMPEASVLALGMVNRVLLRVRNHKGVGLANIPVRVKHKTLSGGEVRQTTDAMGLIAFKINAKQPSIRLKIAVKPLDKPWVTMEEPMRPRGSRMLLRTKTPIFRPGDAIEATLTTWEAGAQVHCDLLQEGAVLWSGEVRSVRNKAKISIDLACAGICHLQCAGHAWDPGDEFATVPIVVTSGATMETLAAVLLAENILHPSSVKVPPGVDPGRAASYFLTFLQQAPFSPALWLNTRDEDIASRDAVRAAGKQKVLFAIVGVFVLIILVVIDLLMRNVIAQRRRMKIFAEETLGDIPELLDSNASAAELALQAVQQMDQAEDSRQLERTRGLLLLLAMVGALIANLVGIIWLFALIG